MPIVTLDTFLERSKSRDSPFDYLIIGGGTAGPVIARRLAENLNATVGLIEAGIYHGTSGSVPLIDTPGFIGRVLNDPSYSWTFQTVPQTHTKNRIIPVPRGKGLGGSSLINYLGLTRPSKQEYNALETTFDNHGWNWDKLLECMKRSENFSQYQTIETRRQNTPPGIYVPKPDQSVHGARGPIHHSHPASWPSLMPIEGEADTFGLRDLFFQAMGKLDVPPNFEPCNGINIGFAKPLMTINPNLGIRSSSVSGYLEPVLNSQENLLVLTGATVTRVLFDKSDGSGKPKAVGLELYIPDQEKRVEVGNIRHEIILSTGTFKTPDILECSGIGDPQALRQYGIECIVDLPGVGGNLQDHISLSMIAEVDASYVTTEVLLDPNELEKQQKLYDEKGEGLLADCASQGFAFLSLQHLINVTGTPPDAITSQFEIEHEKYIQSLHLPKEVQQGYKKQWKLQTDWLSDTNESQIEIINFLGNLPINGLIPPAREVAAKKRYLTLTASLMHPFSRGAVHHSPPDSNSITAEVPFPKIDPSIFSHPIDLRLLLLGLEYIIHLTQTEPLKSAVKTWVFPAELSAIDLDKACNNADSESKAKLKQVLEEHANSWVRTIYHAIGTAAMMKKEDGGVVDERLKVHGVDGLRVADVSILPMEISSHTVSAAYAIGEMASEILIEDYENSH
ncbi:GMC oxidoreductase [Macrolepiota fuliginosa MF-IS2]|uniref:pyranose dehydrogenase (acceptor) n=1 Tax=Macrolepiota fuliginosa MF-IS2 TaxID=1400762 RepID=A0A9P6C740_9AGAR|nr:GMC oxidoreductase [Macrolepiota fuliginosa MF-IS2]